MTEKRSRQAILYLIVMILFSLWRVNLFEGHRLTVEGDGGLIHYAITDNIQKTLALDFENWTNRRIYYPHTDTLAFTDHFYLHSLIGLPYYIFTHDPLNTYNFIYFLQLIIAASGFYLLARQLGASVFATIFSGIYFTFMAALAVNHPQINFYGFIAWFVFFCLKFVETEKARYIYLSGLAYLLQSLVGIYFQLFVFMIAPFFLLFSILHLRRNQKMGAVLKRKFVIPVVLTLVGIGGILLLVNLPYLEFKAKYGQVRPLFSLIRGSADLMEILNTQMNGYSSILALLGAILILILPRVQRIKGRSTETLLPFGWKVVWLSSATALVIWLFGLGPILKVNDVDTGLKLPYYFLYDLHFVFRSIRVPSRIWILLTLPISLVLLCMLEETRRKYSHRIAGKIALIVFVSVIVFDIHERHLLKKYSYVYQRTYIYQTINRLPGEVMLELPSGASHENLKGRGSGKFRDDGYFQFLHIYHQKWTVNGDSGYNPGDSLRIIQQIDESFDDERALRNLFQSNSISLVLIHRRRILPDSLPKYKTLLMNLLRFGRIIQIDREYVLLSIDARKEPREKGELRKFQREWESTLIPQQSPESEESQEPE